MKPAPKDGTRKDFYDLLDRACTTIVQPKRKAGASVAVTRKPKGKPVSPSGRQAK